MRNSIGNVNNQDAAALLNHTGSIKTVHNNNQDPIDIPYTIAGSQKIFNDMRTDMESVTDVLIAKTIESVMILLTNDKKEAVEVNPTNMSIVVKMKALHAGLPTELKFETALIAQNYYLIGTDVPQLNYSKANFPFTANIKCHDFNCRVIELRLKKYPIGTDLKSLKNIVAFGQVGILYRSSYPKIRVVREKNRNAFAAPSLVELEKSGPDSKALRTSVVVIDGPSYSHIQVKDLLDVDTELLDTEETSIDVKSVRIKNDDKLTGQLSGNDPSTGSLIVDIKNNDTQDVARVYFEDEEEAAEAKASTSLAAKIISTPRNSSKTLFKIKSDSVLLPETTRVSAAFVKYESDPYVETFIKSWLGGKEPVGCKNPKGKIMNTPSGLPTLKKFLTYAPNIATHLEGLVEKIDVTPEIGYLLLIESAYAKDPNYPTQIKSNTSTALGPWQILYSTAVEIRDKTNPKVPFGIYPGNDKRDDRTYFLNSTYIAALYLESFFNQFQDDPALAILAYYSGPGSTSLAGKKTDSYTQFSTTLSEIQKYHMQTKTNCDGLNYAHTFLAARTIGQNLDFYGLDNIEPAKTEAYKVRLKNPSGTLPAGL